MVAEQDARVGWIDAARGLGIVSVVAGHTVQNAPLHHLLYAFHMPLFFMLSGFVYRDPRSMGELVQKRFFSLVVPYCAFLVLVAVLDIALGVVTGQNWLTATPRSVIFLAFGGSVLHGSLTAFWFVPCLFFTNLLYAALSRRVGGASTAWMAAFALASYVVACLLSFVHRDVGQPSQTPLGTGQVLFALPFFWTGALLAQRRLSAVFYGVALAAFALCLPWSPAIDMKTLDFGAPGLSFAVALAGSMGLIFVAMLAEGRTGVGAGLEALGRASLVIMFLHMLVQMHLSPYLPGWLVTPLAVVFPFAVFIGMERSAWTRTLFLGMGAKGKITKPSRVTA